VFPDDDGDNGQKADASDVAGGKKKEGKKWEWRDKSGGVAAQLLLKVWVPQPATGKFKADWTGKIKIT